MTPIPLKITDYGLLVHDRDKRAQKMNALAKKLRLNRLVHLSLMIGVSIALISVFAGITGGDFITTEFFITFVVLFPIAFTLKGEGITRELKSLVLIDQLNSDQA